MTKLGIAKIEWIPAAGVADWGAMPRGSTVAVAGYIITGYSFRELPAIQTEAALTENWNSGGDGTVSEAKATGKIRRNIEPQRDTLTDLLGVPLVLRITTVDGQLRLMGSRQCPCMMSYGSNLQGLSSNELAWTASCRSTHGVLKAS